MAALRFPLVSYFARFSDLFPQGDSTLACGRPALLATSLAELLELSGIAELLYEKKAVREKERGAHASTRGHTRAHRGHKISAAAKHGKEEKDMGSYGVGCMVSGECHAHPPPTARPLFIEKSKINAPHNP